MDGTQILINFSNAFPAIQEAIIVTFYLVGFSLLGFGFLRMMREKRKGNTESTSFMMIIVGSLLLALPETMTTLTQTFLPGTDPRQIFSAVPNNEDPTRVVIQVVLNFMVLVGWVSGGRGLIMIGKTGDQYQKDGFYRGFTHLIGGVILINIVPFIHLFGVQLGIDDQVSIILGV